MSDLEELVEIRYCDLCDGVIRSGAGPFCSECKPWVQLLVHTLSRVLNRANFDVRVALTVTKDRKMPGPQKVKKDVVKIAAELATAAMGAKIYETMKPDDIGDFCLDVAKRIAVADDVEEEED